MSRASTPTQAATAISSSVRRKASSRRNAVTSISWIAAKITIPPSAAVGMRDRRECANSRTTSTAAATASEYALVLLPTVTAMAVLVPLLLTGKPCTNAEPALATPSASNSRFATISSPRRANERAVTTSSLKPTISTVNAGSSSSRSSCGCRAGSSTVGSRAGTGPTTPTPPGRKAATATVASRTASSGPGMRGQRHRRSRRNPRTDSGDREDGRLEVAKPAGERTDLGEEGLAGDRDAGHVLELVGDHDQGHAGHVADQDGSRQQVRDEAQPQQPGRHRHQPDEQGQRAREFGVPGRISGGQRLDGHEGHQRGRRLGTHGQRFRRAEEYIDDQRREGGPQAGDRRQARDRRVRHDLRHQVGRDGDTGQQVTGQPGTAIAAQLSQSRDHAPFLPMSRPGACAI